MTSQNSSSASRSHRITLAAILPLILMGCTSGGPATGVKGLASAQGTWWENLRGLCGKAYAGALASNDPADVSFAGQSMAMHVRKCEDARIEIPFHVGEDRSRTWVLSRTGTGIELKHDHRHEDGSEDEITLYGGHTESPGTAIAQLFPVDEDSKKLFVEHDRSPSTTNVWSMEIVPGERFSYILRRPGRHFQVDFDLTRTIEPPPAPWGH
ncbi:MAG TPA: hypothetical protein VF179_07140 [Thermoanaerobaculia bacterium]|nr:hypothetical protein [Thermoanaerobaculia bacterium]